jgi:hypothetical protein
MTEAEWLAAGDQAKLVHLLVGSASERKLRLGACACCRTVENRFYLPEAKAALDHCERFADELDNVSLRNEMVRLGGEVRSHNHSRNLVIEEGIALLAVGFATQVCENTAEYRQYVCHVVIALLEPSNVLRKVQLYRALRCVFGDPFRPVAAESEWLTSTVVALAEGVYADRAFDRLPILADALQDAGCDNESVLNHCRGPGPHVRGCWVIDLLLGKE